MKKNYLTVMDHERNIGELTSKLNELRAATLELHRQGGDNILSIAHLDCQVAEINRNLELEHACIDAIKLNALR